MGARHSSDQDSEATDWCDASDYNNYVQGLVCCPRPGPTGAADIEDSSKWTRVHKGPSKWTHEARCVSRLSPFARQVFIGPKGAGVTMKNPTQLTFVIRVPPRQADQLSTPRQRAAPKIVVARKTFVGDQTVQRGVYALHREGSKANCL